MPPPRTPRRTGHRSPNRRPARGLRPSLSRTLRPPEILPLPLAAATNPNRFYARAWPGSPPASFPNTPFPPPTPACWTNCARPRNCGEARPFSRVLACHGCISRSWAAPPDPNLTLNLNPNLNPNLTNSGRGRLGLRLGSRLRNRHPKRRTALPCHQVLVTGGSPPLRYGDDIVDGGIRQPPVSLII